MSDTEALELTVSPEVLLRTIERERKSRKMAEQLLEDKSRELFLANEELQKQYQSLQKTQGQLFHSEKMASVGQLAAGVAHEINNPVGFVTSNMQTLTDYIAIYHSLLHDYAALVDAFDAGDTALQKSLKGKISELEENEDITYIMDDTCELLNESQEGLHRVKEIVQNLKSFVHLDKSVEQLADINEGIESTLKVAWNELKYKAEVIKNYGELPRIRCFAGELNQVFLNLLVNAVQAIDDRGTITITTISTNGEVRISIADNGRGIAPEHRGQLFDPFFTTKPVGQGTGLGLSVSYGIIQKHRGLIEVDSIVGKGSTFTVRLPVSATGEQPALNRSSNYE